MNLRHHFERSTGGELGAGVAEELESTCELAARAPDAFGDGRQLAALARVENDDSVRLAQIALAEK
jgi:hypothetical protein